jgi:hypothetical protein
MTPPDPDPTQPDPELSSDAPSDPATASAEPTGPPPTDAELQAAWEEQLKHITASDILVQTVVSLVNLAGRRLGIGPDGDGERDLDEARLSIDAVRALVPVLERTDLGPTMKPLRDALASLQFEYAKLAPTRGAAAGGAGGATGAGAPPANPAGPSGPDPASRLWVPGR